MSGQINTGESKFKAQMSIVFEAQMSCRFTAKKAQTSCARFFVAQIILSNFKTGGANVALEKKSWGAKGRIFGANGSLPVTYSC